MEWILGLLVAFMYQRSVIGVEPTFDVPILNVTVVAGQTALLPCSIEHLGKHKVAWMDSGVTLTYEDRRVVDDWRFSVVRPYLREWNLQIRDVQWPDQDMYRCTINTTPVKSKIVSLHVKVPAQIIDELSSDDVIVEEGETVVLVCNVTGVPRPEVTWFRRSAGSSGSAPGHKEPIGLDMVGEMIIIQNVSRYCDDYYECVANNGVPPAVNREIRVTVEFPPEIHMPTPKISQYIGKDTILDCVITAFPQANNVWKKDGREISSNSRFRISAYEEGDNTLTLSLRIHSIRHSDYGEYTCEASNALGKDEQKTILSEIKDFQPPINPEGSGNPIVIPMTPGTKPPSHNNHNTYPGYNTDEQKPSPHKDPGSAGNEDSSQSHGNRGSKPGPVTGHVSDNNGSAILSSASCIFLLFSSLLILIFS